MVAAAGGGHWHGGGAGIARAAQQLLGQALNDWEANDDELEPRRGGLDSHAVRGPLAISST